MMIRKVASTLSPTMELTEKDGTYTLKMISTFRSQEINFRLGDEEMDEETMDGRKVKVEFNACDLG
jgi:hypothetical protein